MADAKIIHYVAFNSILAPISMIKKNWKRHADKFIENGAMKVISSVAENVRTLSNFQLKFVSKSVWELEKFRACSDIFDESKYETKWTVAVDNMGSFITAAVDFKDLSTVKSSIDAELITSPFDKIVIAVRCKKGVNEDESFYLRRSKAGGNIKEIVNEILCSDYDNFLGYVLYKRIDLHGYTTDIENLPYFDWIVEAFLGHKSASYLSELLEARLKELNNDGFDVKFGIFRDNDCLPLKMEHSDFLPIG